MPLSNLVQLRCIHNVRLETVLMSDQYMVPFGLFF